MTKWRYSFPAAAFAHSLNSKLSLSKESGRLMEGLTDNKDTSFEQFARDIPRQLTSDDCGSSLYSYNNFVPCLEKLPNPKSKEEAARNSFEKFYEKVGLPKQIYRVLHQGIFDQLERIAMGNNPSDPPGYTEVGPCFANYPNSPNKALKKYYIANCNGDQIEVRGNYYYIYYKNKATDESWQKFNIMPTQLNYKKIASRNNNTLSYTFESINVNKITQIDNALGEEFHAPPSLLSFFNRLNVFRPFSESAYEVYTTLDNDDTNIARGKGIYLQKVGRNKEEIWARIVHSDGHYLDINITKQFSPYFKDNAWPAEPRNLDPSADVDQLISFMRKNSKYSSPDTPTLSCRDFINNNYRYVFKEENGNYDWNIVNLMLFLPKVLTEFLWLNIADLSLLFIDHYRKSWQRNTFGLAPKALQPWLPYLLLGCCRLILDIIVLSIPIILYYSAKIIYWFGHSLTSPVESYQMNKDTHPTFGVILGACSIISSLALSLVLGILAAPHCLTCIATGHFTLAILHLVKCVASCVSLACFSIISPLYTLIKNSNRHSSAELIRKNTSMAYREHVLAPLNQSREATNEAILHPDNGEFKRRQSPTLASAGD